MGSAGEMSKWNAESAKLLFLGPMITCKMGGTSLVVRGLRLCAPSAGGPGSIPGSDRTRSEPESPALQMDPSPSKLPGKP